MEHRADLEPGLFHPAEAGFDDPGAFVSERHIFGRKRVVIGDDDELAVEFLGGLDLRGIEPGTAEVVGAEIAAIASRRQQRAGRLGVMLLALVEQLELDSESSISTCARLARARGDSGGDR